MIMIAGEVPIKAEHRARAVEPALGAEPLHGFSE